MINETERWYSLKEIMEHLYCHQENLLIHLITTSVIML